MTAWRTAATRVARSSSSQFSSPVLVVDALMLPPWSWPLLRGFFSGAFRSPLERGEQVAYLIGRAFGLRLRLRRWFLELRRQVGLAHSPGQPGVGAGGHDREGLLAGTAGQIRL